MPTMQLAFRLIVNPNDMRRAFLLFAFVKHTDCELTVWQTVNAPERPSPWPSWRIVRNATPYTCAPQRIHNSYTTYHAPHVQAQRCACGSVHALAVWQIARRGE